MLLDPAKEKFHSPPFLVDLGDSQRWKCEVVSEELKPLAGLRVAIGDAAQRIRICRGRSTGSQNDRMVAAQAGGLVHGARVAALEQHIGFSAHDEEDRLQGKAIEPFEIDITAIHHVEGTGFEGYFVEHVDVVY